MRTTNYFRTKESIFSNKTIKHYEIEYATFRGRKFYKVLIRFGDYGDIRMVRGLDFIDAYYKREWRLNDIGFDKENKNIVFKLYNYMHFYEDSGNRSDDFIGRFYLIVKFNDHGWKSFIEDVKKYINEK